MRRIGMVVVALVLCGSVLCLASSANAKTLSINFHQSGHGAGDTLGAAESAGVVAAINWNNVDYQNGAPILNDNNGTWETTVAAGGLNDDSGGALASVALRVQGQGGNGIETLAGGPSSNHTMMTSGFRSINRFNQTTHAQVELTNLLSEFQPGYDVYVYIGTGFTNNAGMGGWGSIARLPAGDYNNNHQQHEGASPYNAGNPLGKFGTQLGDAGFQTLELPAVYGGAFVESSWASASVFTDFPSNTPAAPAPVIGNYVKMSGISDDTLTLMAVNDRFSANSPGFPTLDGGFFDTLNILGVQIDGLAPGPDPADTDKDGDVDTADLTVMFQNFTGDVGAAGGKTMMDGDTDMDGDVDTADITLGFQNFTGASVTSLASVPEPSSIVLMALGLVGLIGIGLRRRKK